MTQPRARDLSDDILYSVFSHTLPSKIEPAEKDMSFWSISPLNLLAVCRSWFEIVVSNPSLWSSVVIGYVDLQSLSMKVRILQALEAWLQRSSPLPLRLVIHASSIGHDTDTTLSELFDIISNHLDRVHDFDISMLNVVLSMGNAPVVFKYSPSTTTFALRYRSLVSKLLLESPDVLDLTSATVQAHSRLQSLFLKANVAWHLPTDSALSFPSLWNLDLGIGPGQSVNDLYSLFAACPNVVMFHLEVLLDTEVGTILEEEADSAFHASARAPIHYPALRQLMISSGHLDSITPIVAWLTCPALDMFTAQGPSTFTPDLLYTMRDMFVRSSPCSRMGVFVLWMVGYPPTNQGHRDMLADALEGILGVLENLSAFSLGDTVVDTRLIQQLTAPVYIENDSEGAIDRRRYGTPAICPRLESFAISCLRDEAYNVPLEVIEDLIESRWRSPTRTLRQVGVSIPGVGVIEEESERLAACKAEGLQIFQA